jgi:hypothetical protein
MMRCQSGDQVWHVTEVVEDGQTITEIHFEKLTIGEYVGQYDPMFYMLPMIHLSQFVEPHYKLWRAFLGDELIGANIVIEDGKIVSYERGRQLIEEFANED